MSPPLPVCVCRTERVPPLPNLASFLVPPPDAVMALPGLRGGGFCAPDFFSLSLIILDVLLLLRDAAAPSFGALAVALCSCWQPPFPPPVCIPVRKHFTTMRYY